MRQEKNERKERKGKERLCKILQSKILLDIKLFQEVVSKPADTKFDSLNFVVGVGETLEGRRDGQGRVISFPVPLFHTSSIASQVYIASLESFGSRFAGR